MSRPLAPDNLRALRNLAVTGCASPAELDKLDNQVKHKPALQRLCALYYIAEADQERGQPVRYELAHKGRKLLAAMMLPIKNPATPREKAEAKATDYIGAELQRMGALRPGALDAAKLPSRIGSRLHWPGGSITDLYGAPLPSSNR